MPFTTFLVHYPPLVYLPLSTTKSSLALPRWNRPPLPHLLCQFSTFLGPVDPYSVFLAGHNMFPPTESHFPLHPQHISEPFLTSLTALLPFLSSAPQPLLHKHFRLNPLFFRLLLSASPTRLVLKLPQRPHSITAWETHRPSVSLLEFQQINRCNPTAACESVIPPSPLSAGQSSLWINPCSVGIIDIPPGV